MHWWAWALVVFVGIPILAAVAAWLATRKAGKNYNDLGDGGQ